MYVEEVGVALLLNLTEEVEKLIDQRLVRFADELLKIVDEEDDLFSTKRGTIGGFQHGKKVLPRLDDGELHVWVQRAQ